MDSKRFDDWTRNRALRLTRRDALRVLGAGGVVTVLPASAANVLAQGTCRLTVHAETAAGPSAPKTCDGILQFTLGPDGAFTQASFASTGGTAQPATGQITGRAIDLQITLSADRTLTLSGVADRPISTCQARAAGILSGPQPGDLGVWHASSDGAAPVTTSSQISTNANPPPSGPSCPAPSFPCGPSCCPSDAICADTNQGICICPDGTIQCGFRCVPGCPNGQTLDLDRCTCFSTCTPDQAACSSDGECCGGLCDNGFCGSCAGLVCGDAGCIDPMNDPNNCGACGNVCVDDTGFCLGGVCQCIPDNEPMGSSSSSCCAHDVKPDGRCGCSHLREACSSVGQCCDNASGAVCLPGPNGFDACCMFPGGACTADDGCCFGKPCIGGVCTDTG